MATPDPLPIRTVVVDDDFMVARLHSSTVTRLDGFEVVGVASTGAQALAVVKDKRPDLVLLDVYLPDLTGLEVLRRLRGLGADCDVIVISAARDLDSLRQAMQSGVYQYLVKPFEPRRACADGSPSTPSTARGSAARTRTPPSSRRRPTVSSGPDRPAVAGPPAQGHQRRDRRPRERGARRRRRRGNVRDGVRRGRGHRAQQRPPLPRAPRRHGGGGRPAPLRVSRPPRAPLSERGPVGPLVHERVHPLARQARDRSPTASCRRTARGRRTRRRS